jgi:hypothetical protein
MNTKELLLIALMLCCAMGIKAQTYYYNESKTFKMTGYTYKCDTETFKLVTLYNINNVLTHSAEIYNATGKIFSMRYSSATLEKDHWTKPKCYSIVNNAFTAEEKLRCKGEKLIIYLYINSQTGRIMEVKYRFLSIDPFATIPVSTYRKIETELKENVWFTPTEEGKKLNYIFLFWAQEPL